MNKKRGAYIFVPLLTDKQVRKRMKALAVKITKDKGIDIDGGMVVYENLKKSARNVKIGRFGKIPEFRCGLAWLWWKRNLQMLLGLPKL
jgi:hypothetical protein